MTDYTVVWLAAITLIGFALFKGSPDMLDAIIFYLTGEKVWP